MLIDANLLLYAVNKRAPQHAGASIWLTEQLNRPRRFGLSMAEPPAFLRISTRPRAFEQPFDPTVAWGIVTDWLAAPRPRGFQHPDPTTRAGSTSSSYITMHAAISSPTRCSLRSHSSTASPCARPTPT